jgi:hypothetical protein
MKNKRSSNSTNSIRQTNSHLLLQSHLTDSLLRVGNSLVQCGEKPTKRFWKPNQTKTIWVIKTAKPIVSSHLNHLTVVKWSLSAELNRSILQNPLNHKTMIFGLVLAKSKPLIIPKIHYHLYGLQTILIGRFNLMMMMQTYQYGLVIELRSMVRKRPSLPLSFSHVMMDIKFLLKNIDFWP